MEKSKSNENLLFAAIDLGSTFSGYAFTIRNTSMKSSVIVNSKWNSSSGGLITDKTPTTLLLDKSLSLLAFGYDAEDVYAELKESGRDGDCHYFPYFKMGFTNQVNRSKNFKISDVNGVEIEALHIFTQALRYLKDNLIERLMRTGIHNDIDTQTWVITVPGDCNDIGKEFLCNAAEKAGIDDLDLILVAETEAALLYCKHQQFEEEILSRLNADVEIFLVDAGGGSVDISVETIKANNDIERIVGESNDSFKAIMIDTKFLQALIDTVGAECMESFRMIYSSDYLELTRYFENEKCKLNVQNPPEIIRVKSPVSLSEENRNYTAQTSERNQICKLRGDKVLIDFSSFKGFFEPIFKGIVSQMTDFFLRNRRTPINKTIFIVGGISTYLPFQEMVADAFQQSRVITPKDSGHAVLYGAVLSGTKFYTLPLSNMKKKAKQLRDKVNTFQKLTLQKANNSSNYDLNNSSDDYNRQVSSRECQVNFSDDSQDTEQGKNVDDSCIPSEKQLAEVCHIISKDWKHLGVELGLELATVNKFENHAHIKTSILEMLTAWRNRFRNKATVAALRNVVKNNENVDMEKFDKCFKS